MEECHRDTAQMMARLVTEGIESGEAEGVIQEIGQLGDVVIPDIKSLRESHPVIYEHLAELRAWSATGISLYTGEHLLGILMVLNPHRHLGEAEILPCLVRHLLRGLNFAICRNSRNMTAHMIN